MCGNDPRLLAAFVTAGALALVGASSAEAKSCGKVRGYKVYTTGVACTTARSYVRRNGCPARWKRFRVIEEFGFEVIGYGCKLRKRSFTAEAF